MAEGRAILALFLHRDATRTSFSHSLRLLMKAALQLIVPSTTLIR